MTETEKMTTTLETITIYCEEYEELQKDRERLNWLETMANEKGGLLLHDGGEKGRRGLGVRLTKRSLRQAIDFARED